MNAFASGSRAGSAPRLTVWFDGACPLCAAEIAMMRRLDRRRAIAFIDVAQPGAATSCPIDRRELLARFHARRRDGRIVSGAAAFAAMWSELPGLRLVGWLAQRPPLVWFLEVLYRIFLLIRPATQRLARRWLR
jgi:predicted DCC family thiol-disulfide oxidoreductase YuxK